MSRKPFWSIMIFFASLAGLALATAMIIQAEEYEASKCDPCPSGYEVQWTPRSRCICKREDKP